MKTITWLIFINVDGGDMSNIGQPPLVVICGPTASGKTDLSIKIAKQFGGEIISADSRAIYKGLDIGTAKPSLAERAGVQHWGIDIVSPGDSFSGAAFKKYALDKISDIRRRGKVPILAGGTGLYINSVVYDYSFIGPSQVIERAKFEEMSISELHQYCSEHNIVLPENRDNKRYVINTIQRNGSIGTRRDSPLENTIFVGITTDKSVLLERIGARADKIFAEQTYQEAERIAGEYGWDNEAMTANVYRLIRSVLNNEITEDAARAEFVTLDWRLAKRQLTWFRRDKNIMWLSLEDADTYLVRALENLNKS